MIVSGYEGVEEKPLRDCTDEDVRAMVAIHSNRGSMKLLDEGWFLRTMLEAREQDRNPLEGVGFFPLLGLGWWRLESEAARRSSTVRWLFRLRGRISDRLRRGDEWEHEGEEPGDAQIALGGSAFGHPGRHSTQ